ncbi:MAG: helix-hairpin-helix domain-containing protein [Gammaproteobacteria bacterium]|jgi:competence protein ComEA
MKFFSKILLVFLLCFAGLAAAADAVNINTADAATLVKALKGVGPDKASAIVAYRQAHGPFKNADDLTQVKGIGEKTVQINREVISIAEGQPENQ